MVVFIFEMLSSNVSFSAPLINLIQEVGQPQKIQCFLPDSILSIHYQFVTLGTLEKRASLLSHFKEARQKKPIHINFELLGALNLYLFLHY